MFMALLETTQEEIMLRDQQEMVSSSHPSYTFKNLKSANAAVVKKPQPSWCSSHLSLYHMCVFCFVFVPPVHPGNGLMEYL